MMMQQLRTQSGEQFPMEGRAAMRPMVETDGVSTLGTQLAAAWSKSVNDAGRSGDQAAAAAAAAQAVARVTGCPEELVALSHRLGAAPIAMRYQYGIAEPLPCAVSIAHSGGRAVSVAIADDAGRRIGVDLERMSTVSAGSLRLFTSRAERALGIDPTTLWTVKEAAWKAFACDEQMPFGAMAVAAFGATQEQPAYIVFDVKGDIIAANAHIWQPWPGWVAAAVEVM